MMTMRPAANYLDGRALQRSPQGEQINGCSSSVIIACQSREFHMDGYPLRHHLELDKAIGSALDEHDPDRRPHGGLRARFAEESWRSHRGSSIRRSTNGWRRRIQWQPLALPITRRGS